MEDWKDKIKTRVDEQERLREEVTSTLRSLLDELIQDGIDAHITEIQLNPLAWEIYIPRKTFTITETDILNNEIDDSEWLEGRVYPKKRTLKENLQDLLVKKYTY